MTVMVTDTDDSVYEMRKLGKVSSLPEWGKAREKMRGKTNEKEGSAVGLNSPCAGLYVAHH